MLLYRAVVHVGADPARLPAVALALADPTGARGGGSPMCARRVLMKRRKRGGMERRPCSSTAMPVGLMTGSPLRCCWVVA